MIDVAQLVVQIEATGQGGCRQMVADLQREALTETAAVLTAASVKAARRLEHLAETAEAEHVSLGAARAVLENAHRYREALDIDERLSRLEDAAEERAPLRAVPS